MILYSGTTSTGTSTSHSFATPVTKVAAQSNQAATFVVQGSLNGTTWATLIASSTYAAGTIRTSTGNFLVSQVRLSVTAYGSTVDAAIHVIGV